MNPRRSSAWIGLRPSPAALSIMVILLAICVANAILGTPVFVREHLLMTPRRGLGVEPWQLVTNAFIHVQLGSLFSTAITLWFFGTPVEQQLGRGRFLQILGMATLAGSLAAAALGRLLAPDALIGGAGPAATAVIAAFGVSYGAQPLLLFGVQQIKASTCAIIFLSISGAMYLVNGDVLGFAGAAAGAAVGAIATRGAGLDGVRAWWEGVKKRRIRRRYKVLPGGRDSRSFLN